MFSVVSALPVGSFAVARRVAKDSCGLGRHGVGEAHGDLWSNHPAVGGRCAGLSGLLRPWGEQVRLRHVETVERQSCLLKENLRGPNGGRTTWR